MIMLIRIARSGIYWVRRNTVLWIIPIATALPEYSWR